MPQLAFFSFVLVTKTKHLCLWRTLVNVDKILSEEDALLAQKNEPQEMPKAEEEALITHLKLETNTKSML